MLDTQLIENPRNNEIDELADFLWPPIEAWRRGKHDSSRSREPQHVLQMNRTERSLARH